MVDKTLKTSSPAQRNVSFQANESDTYTEDEKLIFAKIREVVGLEHDEARIWREIRLHVQGDNEDRAANVINLMIDSAPQHHHQQQQADVLKDLPSSTTIEKSNENNLETNAQTSEPMEVDSFAVAPYYGPHEASTSTHTSTHDREESDLQKALKESLKVSNNLSSYEQSLPSDLETVVRNADSSTGLFNAGNTCWFNCVAQILYHLPMFRKIIYNSVPDEWERVDESKNKPETVTVKDFVIVLRKLFAEMYFSTVSYIDPTEVLQVVDALTRRCSSSPDTSVLGQQQDATESLIRIMEWLEKGIREGLKEMRDPKEKQIEQVEEASYIPENSTSVAPNSDVVGTAPPVYTEEVKPELGSLSNVPIKPCDIRNQFQEKMRKTVGEELTEAGNAKKLDLSIERVGEMNEKDRRGQYVSPKPPLAKRERMEEPMKLGEANSDATAANVEPDQHEDQNVQVADGAHVRTDGDQPDKQDYELLEQRLDDLFAATFCTVTHNESSGVIQEMSEPSCPLYFQLQVSYGNLHDALEASSFDKLPEAGKCRETWYETLPAAIFMGLSRFSYNVGTSEKLHNRFLFPKVLYMDRYMKKNAKKVLELRKDQKVLREKLAQVKAELKGYLEYPHGENTEKIADLLETVRKVLSNNIAREDPIDSNNATNFIGPCSSKKSHIETKSFVEDLGKQFPRFTSETFPHLSECINTLEAIEDDVKMRERELRTREEELVAALDTLYNKKEMHDYEYDLQAVIIHSGEANRGHYWTYSRKQSGNTQEEWEKLNDKQIEIVPWEKVAKDAYGDDMASSPSAYCLVYVRSDAKWLFEQNFLTHQEALNELPEDLKKLVTEKQKIASENLDRFLEEKARKAQEEEQEASKRWMNRRGESRSARRTLSNTRRSDENANPNIIGIPNNSIRAPLSEQQCVLDDDAVKDLETSAERMNDTIKTMSPNKFQDVGDIINYWLMDLMASFGTGFLLRALDEVSGFKKENEVFSDYSKEHIYVTYEKFIEHFVPTVERSVGARDNIISFLKSTITAIDPWVWRYMLVKALSMGGTDSPFTMKARSELGMYTRMHPRAAKNVQKVAMWCGLLYENLNITMCMCSQSIDMFLQHENETNQHKCVEYSYYALKKARAARYAYNVFKSELMQAEQQILTEKESIDYTFIQIATLCPLLRMTKVFLPFVVNKGRKMTEIAYPTGDGKKIEANDVVNEIVYALYAVRRWKQNKTAVDESFFNCINDIYEKSSILWDTVAALGVPTNDASKKFYVNKIRDLFHTNHLLEEKCPNEQYWSGGIRAEHAKLVGFANRIGVSQNLIATIFGEANIIISQSLENL